MSVGMGCLEGTFFWFFKKQTLAGKEKQFAI